MPETNPFVFTVERNQRGAVKSVGLNALQWDLMWNNNLGKTMSEFNAFQQVAWVRRCVEVRSNALSAIPCQVYKGKDKYEWPLADLLPQLLWRCEAALQLYGAAYIAREKNLVIQKNLRWLSPLSITPLYDTEQGLTGFERKVKGKKIQLKIDDLIYIWRPSLDVELGPGSGWVSTVLDEAAMSHYSNVFAKEFFERGAIPAVILSVEGNPQREELDRLEAWWKHLLAGVKRAWETVAVKASVKPQVIGYPTDQLAMPELAAMIRGQILAAAGVPGTMVLSDTAQVATRVSEDRLAFYTETIIPEALLIQEALNNQYFKPQNLEIVLDYQSMDIFQEDESARAVSLGQLVTAMVDLGDEALPLAMEILGYDLPEMLEYGEIKFKTIREIIAAKPAPPPPAPVMISKPEQALLPAPKEEDEETETEDEMPTQKAIEIRKEIRRWHTKALKSFKAGKGADVPFDSEILPAEYVDRVRAAMVNVADEDAIANAFSKAADTIPLVLVITEEDIAKALESWDALMPEEFKGMLAAKPTGVARVDNG